MGLLCQMLLIAVALCISFHVALGCQSSKTNEEIGEPGGQSNAIQVTTMQDPTDLHASLSCDRGTCKNRCFHLYSPPIRQTSHLTDEGSYTYTTGQAEREPAGTACQCDEMCIIFGDCCFDYFHLCHNKNISTLVSALTCPDDIYDLIKKNVKDQSYFNIKMLMLGEKTCTKVNTYKNSYIYLWAIQSCPDENQTNHNGNKPAYNIPVSFRHVSGIVFSDVYYAVCNGVERENLKLWNYSTSCTYNEADNERGFSQSCVINVKPPTENFFRRCFVSEIQRESELAIPFAQTVLSKSYTYQVYLGKEVYKNPHSLSKTTRDAFDLSCEPTETIRFQKVLLPYCPSTSCQGFCSKGYSRGFRLCECDDDCVLYGDCCYDYTFVCLKTELSLVFLMQNPKRMTRLVGSIDDGKSLHRVESEDRMGDIISRFIDFKSCVNLDYVFSTVDGLVVNKSIWMISSCPKDFVNDKVRSLCEQRYSTSLDTLVPISLGSYRQVIFRNRHCAVCHEQRENKLIPWKASLNCPIIENYADMNKPLREGKCRVVINEETGSRLCFKSDQNVKDSFQMCSKSNNISFDNITIFRSWCTAYRYEIILMNNSLRNPHCGFGRANMSCLHYEINYQDIVAKYGGLGTIFNVNREQKPQVTCSINEVYDSLYGICRELVCLHGKVAVNGKCTKNGTWFAERGNQLLPNGYRHCFLRVYLNGKKSLNQADRALMKDNVAKRVENIIAKKGLKPLFSDVYTDMFGIFPNMSGATVLNGSSFTNLLEITFGKKGPLITYLSAMSYFDEVIHEVSTHHSLERLKFVMSNYEYARNSTCNYGTLLTFKNITMEAVQSELYANYSDRLYPLENVIFNMTFVNATPVLEAVSVCDIPLECSLVVYNFSHFHENRNTLRNINHNLVIRKGSYYISGQLFYTCANFTSYKQTLFIFNPIQAVLTYAVSGISIVALLLTLCVYAFVGELRNLPGRLNMSLSASMMLAQSLLLLIHILTGVLCKTLAIILHFIWLSTFMWMSIISINLTHTFISKARKSPRKTFTKTHFKLSLCAFGIPLLIVIPALVLDLMDIPDLFIGYGAFGVCWIANPTVSLLLFIIPVSLMLLMNTIAFIVTFYHIEKITHMSKDVESTRKEKGKFFIYGKLFVIMGLSWSSSFIAAFTDNSFLWYIFIILNGLQGLYIFISFICTEKVKGLLLKRCMDVSSDVNTVTTKRY